MTELSRNLDVLDIEKAVIGAIFATEDRENLEKTFATIDASFFTNGPLSKVYAEVKSQYQNFGTIDPLITCNNLGAEYKKVIVACVNSVPSARLLPQYTIKLLQNYRKQLLYKDLEEIKESILINSPFDNIMQDVNNMVAKQEKLNEVQDSTTALDFLDSVVEFINSMTKKNGAHKTGLKLLDYVLGGFMPGSVAVISGRSGMGKSDFAIYLALKLAINKARVLYLTMEMPRTQIVARIVSNVAQIDSVKIRDNLLTQSEYATIATITDKLNNISLILDEQQNLSVNDIAAKVKKYKPDVVVIDHFGLMATDKYKKLWESIAQNSKDIKQLAMATGISVISLVQQGAQAEKRAEKTAYLSDLKGSDAINNDADVVMFIRSDKSGKDEILAGKESFDTTIQIEKNRHGRTGMLKFKWQPQYHKYFPVETREG